MGTMGTGEPVKPRPMRDLDGFLDLGCSDLAMNQCLLIPFLEG